VRSHESDRAERATDGSERSCVGLVLFLLALIVLELGWIVFMVYVASQFRDTGLSPCSGGVALLC